MTKHEKITSKNVFALSKEVDLVIGAQPEQARAWFMVCRFLHQNRMKWEQGVPRIETVIKFIENKIRKANKNGSK